MKTIKKAYIYSRLVLFVNRGQATSYYYRIGPLYTCTGGGSVILTVV